MMNLKINVGSTQIMAPVNKSLKAAPNPAAKAPSFYLNKVQQEMPYNPHMCISSSCRIWKLNCECTYKDQCDH